MNIFLKAIVVVSFLAAFSLSATFSINSISTCTNQSATGFCTQWSQNGSVTQTTTCFPANAQLIVLENGQEVVKKMSMIKTGDKVLASDGNKNIYTPVIGWLHRQVEKSGKYLKITTQISEITISALHNIALQDGSYVFAKQSLGKYLHNGQKVIKIQGVVSQGIYAPMTEAGTFFVTPKKGEKSLVHSFANINNPTFYHPFVLGIWKIWEAIYGEYNGSSIHPAAEWMMKTFEFLVVKEKKTAEM